MRPTSLHCRRHGLHPTSPPWTSCARPRKCWSPHGTLISSCVESPDTTVPFHGRIIAHLVLLVHVLVLLHRTSKGKREGWEKKKIKMEIGDETKRERYRPVQRRSSKKKFTEAPDDKLPEAPICSSPQRPWAVVHAQGRHTWDSTRASLPPEPFQILQRPHSPTYPSRLFHLPFPAASCILTVTSCDYL